jgi:PAS domain-containing protein
MKPPKTASPPTHAPARARPKGLKPGLRALDACDDGFWECDLIAGSAWFNDWFYRKLDWPLDAKRSALGDLQPALRPGVWDRLMGMLRDHLEKGFPLDLEIEVQVPGARLERWRMQGSAQRNAAGQPVYLAGSMRELRDEPANPAANIRACLASAFDALPVAAALLDSRAIVIVANQLWRKFPEATADQAVARLRAANGQTAIEFWLDEGAHPDVVGRQLRVRAVAFQHEGSRHLAVTLEDRRSD